MTDDVLVTISGNRRMGAENENVELVIPGSYSLRDGMHTVRYEEPAEGFDASTENVISIGGGCMQIEKHGLANVRMEFLNSTARTVSCYSTPFGDLMIGIMTNDIEIRESRDQIMVVVDYSMDIGDERMSDCRMKVLISSRGKPC